MAKRLAVIGLIFVMAGLAWMGLGGLTMYRTESSSAELRGEVGELWGMPHSQPAPEVYALVPGPAASDAASDGTDKTLAQPALVRVPVQLVSSDVRTRLDIDYRKKGLLWFNTYDVDFSGRWVAVNTDSQVREFVIVFRFPTAEAMYDNFSFTVNGRDATALSGGGGYEATALSGRTGYEKVAGTGVETSVKLAPDDKVSFAVAYESRGLDTWSYRFGPDVTQVRDFTLVVETDFEDIDFPARAISPTSKERTGTGWLLTWRTDNLISGFEVGVKMPERLNPGPLAAKISFFAPVSLLFFFFVIFILGVLRGINLHPMHYLFLAAAFFSFHLLFAYLVDHIDVHLAFVVSSVVSVGLVVSYLRLVAGNRFAFVEAGLAQLLYLVLFSYTHFLEGYTGLVVTVGAVLTLFVLMQLTAKVDWDVVFAGRRAVPGGRPEDSGADGRRTTA